MINFHYRLWLADGSPFEESFSFPVCFRRTDIASLEARLRRMADLWTETGTGSFEAAALAHAIVGEHLCRLGVKDQLRVKTDPAMENLALRLADEREFSFRAPDEARHCGLSVSQMNRRFRQTFGCSPRRFREQKVFTRVCLGLSRSGESIWQVAQKNGFNDEAYFCRWFRRLAGCPPSAFRKRASAAHRAW
jgi:AraC-like DNA-binding protein